MPDLPPETASFQSQSVDLSNSDTISLIYSLLDAKLQKTGEREVETRRELKKLKTDSEAANSLKFKGKEFSLSFSSQLLDCLDQAISSLSEGNLQAVSRTPPKGLV